LEKNPDSDFTESTFDFEMEGFPCPVHMEEGSESDGLLQDAQETGGFNLPLTASKQNILLT